MRRDLLRAGHAPARYADSLPPAYDAPAHDARADRAPGLRATDAAA
ncbi:hypothetical protein NQ156_14060 [Microbacterium sp. zg.Y625]|nr:MULTISPECIES: hypothetical protein [unclassified Microbacterium]MCR2794196.1 hypothetical protein [Microbacterium sp. zg.Y625]WIM25510.1 hypothetical protein QNO14_00210 [Microbacterium sp. zg-Y625]